MLLPENKKEASLNEILNNYFSGENVEFEYKFNNCNKKVKHLKYIRFSILPKILIISLQRIDVLNNKKNDINVIFDDYLDIENFIDKDILQEVSSKYKLNGIVCQRGNFNFWSLYCLFKYRIKRSISVIIIDNGLPTDNTYILFYIKNDLI